MKKENKQQELSPRCEFFKRAAKASFLLKSLIVCAMIMFPAVCTHVIGQGLTVDHVENVGDRTITFYNDGSYYVEIPHDNRTSVYKCDSNNRLLLFGDNFNDGRADIWWTDLSGTWVHQTSYICPCNKTGGVCTGCSGSGKVYSGMFTFPCFICYGSGRCNKQHDDNGRVYHFETYQTQVAVPNVEHYSPSSSYSSGSSSKLCPTCNGTGTCTQCNGKGWFTSKYGSEPARCALCPGGNGKCGRCGGSGRI
ncbi:MAG: hypothetical protein IJU35_03465 [Paludibacteraceae bacterium]|nr:hypothetical protein [Paludibacteraceae bacterium]